MKQPLFNRRFVSTAFVILLFAARVAAFQKPAREELSNFDKRREAIRANPGTPEQQAAAARLRTTVPKAEVKFDPLLGSSRSVSAHDGFLTGADGRGRGVPSQGLEGFAATDRHRALKAFLRDHRALFNHGPEALESAQIRRESVFPGTGLRSVVWQQQLDGLPVFEAVLIAHITRRDELVQVSSHFLPDPPTAAARGVPNRAAMMATPPISARQAVALAAQNLGEPLTESGPAASPDLPAHAVVAPQQPRRFRAAPLLGEVEAKLVWLPLNRDTMRLCWEIICVSQARGETFRVLIDAGTGEALVRHCLTEYLATEASFRIFTSDSPTPFSPGHPTPLQNQPPAVARQFVTLTALDTNASPMGWLNDGDNETRGNNIDAHTDGNNDNQPDLPRPHGSPARVFDFPMDLARPPTTYSDAAVVQLFYWCNWMHDRLYELGFDEAAGNFQADNFGRGGLGNDAVQADAQDGGGVNNANMATPADGSAPRMQMYIFDGPSPGRDGDFDAEIVLHEYTHGLSNRRVGGGVGLSALQSRGMGEGWSDFYGLALLSEPGDNVDGNYAAGAYATYLLSGLRENYYYGIRRYPYSTDLTKNPLTFKDIDSVQASAHSGVSKSPIFGSGSASEVHNQGEVWCVTLWEARAAMIRKHGFATGNQLILQLVTDGMALSPPNPTFVEARDGILQADRIDTGGANLPELWAAFARRGLGFSAVAPSASTTAGIEEAYDLPDDLRLSPRRGFTASGPAGGPFAPSSLTLTLTNAGTNTFAWAASAPDGWLNLSLTGGTLTPGGAAQSLAVALDPVANSLPTGVYSAAVWLTNLHSGNVQSRQFTLRVGRPDYLTEQFAASEFDLSYQTLTFTPDNSVSRYTVCREPAIAFPTDPAGGTALDLSVRYSLGVTLPPGTNVAFMGQSYNRLYVGRHGSVTFSYADFLIDESLAGFFLQPRIAALHHFQTFGPGTSVSWKMVDDRMAVTWRRMVDNILGPLNDYQIEIFFDGRIRITWLAIGSQTAMVGLSRTGTLAPSDFVESDLSSYGSCLPALRLTLPNQAREGAGVLTNGGSLFLPAPLATNLTVQLRSSHTNELVVPPTVTIFAGTSGSTFDLAVQDDALLDGSQRPNLIASASGFVSAVNAMFVDDNETATLGLILPANVREGDGSALAVLTVSAPPASSVAVLLTSRDPTELTVPTAAIIPAGRTSTVFSVTVVDDNEIDGPRVAAIEARMTNWVAATNSIIVQDNEAAILSVQLPSVVAEGQGTRTNAGIVRASGTVVSNVFVNLRSSDTNRLRVMPGTNIYFGGSQQSFDLIIVDNAASEGPTNVTVTAQAGGFASGSNTLIIADNESPLAPFRPDPPDLSSNVAAQPTLSWRAHEGEMLVNGDFESGDLTGWSRAGAVSGGFIFNNGAFDPPGPEPAVAPFAGRFCALGQQREFGTYQLWQIVTLPAEASGAELRWMDRIHNYSANSGYFNAAVYTEGGSFLKTLATFNAYGTNNDWTSRRFDVSEFLGQTIRVTFTLYSSAAYIDAGLDNVSLRLTSPTPTTYQVFFGTNPAPSQLLGTTTNTSLAPPLLDPLATYYWRVAATRGTTATAPAWQFTTRGVNHFDWSPVGATQFVGEPFQAALTARDELGRAVTNFTGPALLRGAIVPGSNAPTVVITEVESGAVDGAEFMNVSAAPVALDGWRMVVYDWRSWPEPLMTLVLPPGSTAPPGGVFKLSEGGSAPGVYPNLEAGLNISWQNIATNNPISLLLRDAAGRVVDFFCAADGPAGDLMNPLSLPASQWSGTPVAANLSDTLNYQRRGNLDQNNSSDWTLAPASLGVGNPGLIVPFAGSVQAVGLAPATSGGFANGVWTGAVTVTEPALGASVIASDGLGHEGASGAFTALLRNDLDLTMTGSPARTNLGGIFTCTLVLTNLGPASATGVFVTNALPAGGQFLSANTTQGSFGSAPGLVIFNVGTLAANARATFQIMAMTTASGRLTNSATFARAEADPYTSNNVAVVTTLVTPELRIGNAACNEGNVGTSNAAFTVALSSAFELPVSVSYVTADGTAVTGSDYVASAGLLVIPPGATSGTVLVAIRGDLAVEPDETFFLDLSAPTNATLGNARATVTIRNDDGLPGAVQSFAFDFLSSPQFVNQPFNVTVTALLPGSVVASNFNGPVSLTARDFSTRSFTSGVDNISLVLPLGGSAHDERAQVIYTAGELGGVAGRINALTLDVQVAPGRVLSNFTVRLKHTSLTAFPRSTWETNDWMLVLRTNLPATPTGLLALPLETPFEFNGTENLMVDFSFNTSVTGSEGYCRSSSRTGARSLYYQANSTYGDPLTWAGSTPQPLQFSYTPNVRFSVQRYAPLTPTVSGAFTNGVWSGPVTVLAPATGLALEVDDRNGHRGASGAFDVLLTNDLALTLTDAPDPVPVGSNVTYTMRVTNSGPAVATRVFVTNRFATSAAFVSAAASQGTPALTGNAVVFDAGTLAGGASAVFTLVVAPGSSGQLTDTATVARGEPDNYAANNSVAATTGVLPTATISDATVLEGHSGEANVTLTATLSGPYDQPVQISYVTRDATAVAGVDYLAQSGTFYFGAGGVTATATFSVFGEALVEANEVFFVNLTSSANVTLIDTQAMVTILNDDGFAGDLLTLEWSAIPSPQLAGQPFYVTLTARDSGGSVATHFSGVAALSGREGAFRTNTIGTNPVVVTYPFGAVYADQRTELIYLASEIGMTGRIAALAFDLSSLPGAMTNFTVRAQHTTFTRFTNNIWDSGGWTVLLQTNLEVLAPGWRTLPLQTAFDYNGTNHLLLDVSFNNDAGRGTGLCRSTYAPDARVLHYEVSNTAGDPLTWAGTTPPPFAGNYRPNTRFVFGKSLPVTPALAGPFTNGVWSGALAVLAPSPSATLFADDLNGHAAVSAPFTVTGDPRLTIQRNGNQVVLRWPAAATGFQLENTLSLRPPAWSSNPAPFFLVGTNHVVTNGITESERFYRLRNPGP